MPGEERFIRLWVGVLGCLGIGSLWVVYSASTDPDFLTPDSPARFQMALFGVVVSLWYLVTAIGLLARKKWGWQSFWCFLLLCLVCFPIGTIAAVMSMRYARANRLKQLFA